MKKVLNFLTDNYIIFCVYALIGWIYEVSWYLIFEHRFVNRGVLFGPFLPIYGFGMLILLFLLRGFIKKRHESGNLLWTSISIITLATFIFTTAVEYTNPKIYDVSFFLERCGINLFLLNMFWLVVINLLIHISKDDFYKKIDLTIVLVFLIIWVVTTLIEYVSHYFIETYFHKMLWDYSHDFLNINRRVNWDASRNFALGGTFLLYTVQPFLDKIIAKTESKKKIIICLIIFIPMLIDFIL